MGGGNIVLRRGCLPLSVLKREQPGGLRHVENTRVRLYLNARPAESRSVRSLCLFGPVHPFSTERDDDVGFSKTFSLCPQRRLLTWSFIGPRAWLSPCLFLRAP